jgi:HD-GYP domain-containing protein (c-di-GMP phosphodiesterase class II)
MAKQKIVTDVPEHLNEEFYQINPDILESFSKYRPPLNIYRFNEDVERIIPYYTVGQRLSNEQVEELSEMTVEGFIFVARTDHPIYVKHISHQLDLVLVDKNLKAREIADIFVIALTRRLEEFMEQPVRPVFQKLTADVFTLTEYLWHDPYRIRSLIKRIHKKHTLANHSFNSGVLGTALYCWLYDEGFKNKSADRKAFDNTVLGMFIHDMGMSKIPQFIRDKRQPLSPDEQQKMRKHPLLGYEMLTKLDTRLPEVEACVLQHHERLDGKGYPQRAKPDSIQTMGRMCAVIDSFAAMITERTYAPAKPQQEALKELAADERYEQRFVKSLQNLIVQWAE